MFNEVKINVTACTCTNILRICICNKFFRVDAITHVGSFLLAGIYVYFFRGERAIVHSRSNHSKFTAKIMFRDARMPSTHTPEHTRTLVRFIY